MASSLQLLIFSSLFISISSLQIMKDGETLQYTTHIHQGTPSVPNKFVLDLGGSSLWTNCESSSSSSSYIPARCRSIQCAAANANKCGASSNTCGLLAKNSVTGMLMNSELGEDVVADFHSFLFNCAPAFLLQGLASGARGIAGLGRNRISLPSQLSRKFSICLPSSSSTNSAGFIHFDTTHHILMYTPILQNPNEEPSSEYYIGVKSMKIHGKRLSIDSSLLSRGTKLSTVAPYTTLETSIYKTFTRAFYGVATCVFNMTRVASVAPFEFCFSSEDIGKTRAGPDVPIIDLVLQSSMVKWRIYGGNSMVKVSDKVVCLGFLDGGGMDAAAGMDSVVLGGFQLENNLLEFDLASSRMGFTSLFTTQIQCSDVGFDWKSS